jgi:hypothetical protein
VRRRALTVGRSAYVLGSVAAVVIHVRLCLEFCRATTVLRCGGPGAWVANHEGYAVVANSAVPAGRNDLSLINGCDSRSDISTYVNRVRPTAFADFAGIDGRSDGVKPFLDAVRGR